MWSAGPLHARSLVVLIPSEDHAAMIRLFFAMKVWVMKEGFSLV